MAIKLFTAITFFREKEIYPVKYRNINNTEKHQKFIIGKYPNAWYTNFYDKKTRKYCYRHYYFNVKNQAL